MQSPLTSEMIGQFQTFLSKIPISKERSDLQRLWSSITDANYHITYDQLDEIKELSVNLPSPLQSFPQVWSTWVKNTPENGAKPQEQKSMVAKTISKGKSHGKSIEDTSVAPTEDNLNASPKEILQTRVDEEDIPELETKNKTSSNQITVGADGEVSQKEASTKSKKSVAPKSEKVNQKKGQLAAGGARRQEEAQAGDLQRPTTALEETTPKRKAASTKPVSKKASKSATKSVNKDAAESAKNKKAAAAKEANKKELEQRKSSAKAGDLKRSTRAISNATPKRKSATKSRRR